MVDWVWVQRRRRRWRERSRHAQVEASTRWTLNTLTWTMYLAGTVPLVPLMTRGALPLVLIWAIQVLSVVQCALGMGAIQRSLDQYLGTGRVPRWRVTALGGLLAALTALVVALSAVHGVRGVATVPMALFGIVTPGLGVLALTVSVRTAVRAYAAYAVVTTAALALAGEGWPVLAATVFMLAVAGASVIVSTRCSGWYIAVMRELDEARDAQSRLAVAEERLRFGRDLHDVMGRNLSVIALKSELAVQLVRRGSPAAEHQMVEVQRLARDSQREVRDVVRGYRRADLHAELAGARGILRAAGTDCRIAMTGTADVELPEPVQSALGWVVREGTTNVLRHADAGRCTVTLRLSAPERGGGTAVLTMENDGAVHAGGGTDGAGGGSGLAGLRERLTAVGGTLTVAPAPGAFRLTAVVPLARTDEGTAADPAEEDPAGGGAPEADGVGGAPAHAGDSTRTRRGRAGAGTGGGSGAGAEPAAGARHEGTLDLYAPGEER